MLSGHQAIGVLSKTSQYLRDLHKDIARCSMRDFTKNRFFLIIITVIISPVMSWQVSAQTRKMSAVFVELLEVLLQIHC